MFNIKTNDGRLMLGDWVPFDRAVEALEYYLNKYRPGKKYPNGKGCYPDYGYHIISEHGDWAEELIRLLRR
jgi:hypothetical protein